MAVEAELGNSLYPQPSLVPPDTISSSLLYFTLRISNLVLIIVIAISGETNLDPQARSRFIPINHVRKFLQRLP